MTGTVILSVSVTGCFGGGSDLSKGDFEAGVCRTSAEPIISIDTAVSQLQDDDKKPDEVLDTLKRSQTRLRALRERADGTLKQQLSDLTNAIGSFRIGIDAGTASPAQTDLVAKALKPVVESCTTS